MGKSGKGGICRDMMVDWIPRREHTVLEVKVLQWFSKERFSYSKPFLDPLGSWVALWFETKTKVLDVSFKVPQISELLSRIWCLRYWYTMLTK